MTDWLHDGRAVSTVVEAVIWHDAIPDTAALATIRYFDSSAYEIITAWLATSGTQRERMAALDLPDATLRHLFSLWHPEDHDAYDAAYMALEALETERAEQVATRRAELMEAMKALDD